jgi:hypothetical protein
MNNVVIACGGLLGRRGGGKRKERPARSAAPGPGERQEEGSKKGGNQATVKFYKIFKNVAF